MGGGEAWQAQVPPSTGLDKVQAVCAGELEGEEGVVLGPRSPDKDGMEQSQQHIWEEGQGPRAAMLAFTMATLVIL